MDSLTQLVLGAACGEAVLGKKIGNKALLFGAIGGTIPDLDVFVGSKLYSNEIQAMMFHRGFMHSIFFAVLGAFAFGWLVFKLYNTGKRTDTTTLRDWILLFFWALFTHPILDAFTPYGTQLFAPFSNYRVAFNNISVADPAYTLPFLICLIVLMFFRRTNKKRKLWLKLGIGISSAYMIFTLLNKSSVDTIFENSLKDNRVLYQRFQTQPSILNNILWYGVAETRSFYYLGYYSLLDKEKTFKNWVRIEKRHDLLPMDDEDLSQLAWFSKNYYNVQQSKDSINEFIYSDLRYPLMNPSNSNSSVFKFTVYKKGKRWDIKTARPDFDESATLSSIFAPMIERLKGI
ncbi:MAG: metal-dependent hydrolase [Winogradskyella sp.]|uniref:metal-dependent hydrolase n=1 Tax=Winogradskyella sp. TaxID=1883156 RepID=UPI000F3D52AF|nr:metal-dependent hydrolase [Winogradskyella sp.]RNC87041.1 MAG: metal-dependent hydrolase [Winogradskyella sp.]